MAWILTLGRQLSNVTSGTTYVYTRKRSHVLLFLPCYVSLTDRRESIRVVPMERIRYARRTYARFYYHIFRELPVTRTRFPAFGQIPARTSVWLPAAKNNSCFEETRLFDFTSGNRVVYRPFLTPHSTPSLYSFTLSYRRAAYPKNAVFIVHFVTHGLRISSCLFAFICSFLFACVTLPGSFKILKELQGIRSECNDAANHLRTNVRRPR